jgi:hypothetical protein
MTDRSCAGLAPAATGNEARKLVGTGECEDNFLGSPKFKCKQLVGATHDGRHLSG